jgi:hypothetical protein
MVDDEIHSKNEEAEEDSAVADDERHDRDVEAGEADSMCQDEHQRVHNIDDTDELVGQEHTDDDEEEDYGIHYRVEVEERSEGFAADDVPGLAEDAPLSQSSRIFSHHLSLVFEEPRCWLERHEEVLNTLAVATPSCFQTCESLSREMVEQKKECYVRVDYVDIQKKSRLSQKAI